MSWTCPKCSAIIDPNRSVWADFRQVGEGSSEAGLQGGEAEPTGR